MKRLFFLLFFFIAATISVASENGATWWASPFKQKVFIENKGQFDGKASSKIFFGTTVDGVELYFSTTGITYRHDEIVRMSEEEREQQGEGRPAKNEERMVKSEARTLTMEWAGAHPMVEIIASLPVSLYCTYAAEEGAILAHAFQKITYKNLYPGIDVEYLFPEGKEGIKYSVIVHPGADISQMEMKYSDAEAVTIDDGNVVIKSSFGNFIDHAPFSTVVKSNQSGERSVRTSFILNGNEVSFSVAAYDYTRELIIDPWTTNPNFADLNSAFDVNYDQNGNVYVYGSVNPFKLTKLNSAGFVQWIFTTPPGFGYKQSNVYGDFAVDEVSGTSYIVEGYNPPGARVLKINSGGIPTGTFPGLATMNEMWRVEYNRCINTIVIAGGGTEFPNQAAILDTNLLQITPVNVLSASTGYHDFALLAVDNTSNFCYMATAANGISGFDNILVKCPVPNLLPLAFSVSDNYKFLEAQSITYAYSNGMNGMAVSPKGVYTYDSDLLKLWDKNTGALIGMKHISLSSPTYNDSGYIQISWGGLSVDECDNIYVGFKKSVRKYSSTFSLVDSFALPDTVYDVKLGSNNKLYACGKGFVKQIDLVQRNTTLQLTQTPADCDSCNGTATVSALSCGGSPAGFSYSWNTNPVQTTQTATHLCPGTYTVTVTTNCYKNFTDSVTVGGAGGLVPTITGDTTLCPGDTAILTASGGIHYLWSTGDTSASIKVHPLITTRYIVTAKNNGGCSGSDTVTVTVNPRPIANAGQDVTICRGDSTVLSASGGSNYVWNTGSTTQSITVRPAVTTTYVVTVIDSSGCSAKDTVIVSVNPSPTVSVSGATSLCAGATTILTASGGNTYIWSTGETTPSIKISPTSTTSYVVTATNSNGCTAKDTVEVVVNPHPQANAGADVTICSGDSVELNAGGGTTYSWTPVTGLNDPTIPNPVAKPTSTTIYTVTVSNAADCTNKDSVLVTVLPSMVNSISPAIVNFGVTGVNTTKNAQAVFHNQNSFAVHVSNIRFNPSFPGTIITPFPQTVAANGTLTINFTATPTDTVFSQSELIVTVDSACRDEKYIDIRAEGVSTCLTPQVTSATIGKRPGDEVVIPIVLDPSAKFANAKTVDLQVTYDPSLLRFISATSSYDPSPKVTLTMGGIAITISPNRTLSTITASIAELHMQALLAPYAEGKLDITSSLITLQSGEEIAAGNCFEMFSLDSSCILPNDLRVKSKVAIEGIYPNPSHGTTTIVANVSGSPVVKVEVFDVFGRRVEVLHDGVLMSGKHELSISTEHYANGIYFCRIIQEGKVLSREFNVQR